MDASGAIGIDRTTKRCPSRSWRAQSLVSGMSSVVESIDKEATMARSTCSSSVGLGSGDLSIDGYFEDEPGDYVDKDGSTCDGL